MFSNRNRKVLSKNAVRTAIYWIAANLGKEGTWNDELPRVLDAYVRGELKYTSLEHFLADQDRRWCKQVGYLGEIVAGVAVVLAGGEVIVTDGAYDLVGIMPNGYTLKLEVKARATVNDRGIFQAGFSRTQTLPPHKGGPSHVAQVHFDRASDGRVLGVMPVMYASRKVRDLRRKSKQKGDRFIMNYTYAAGKTAKKLGLTSKPLTLDQVVREMREL